MALSRCSKLFGYYLKSKKRPNTSLRARNPRSFTASPEFKTQKSIIQATWARFAGLECATWNSFSDISCLWVPGLACFCPSTFHSPLRITKNIWRKLHVCPWLGWELLRQVDFVDVDASGILGSPACVLLHYARLCELPKTYHDFVMCLVGWTKICYQKQ